MFKVSSELKLKVLSKRMFEVLELEFWSEFVHWIRATKGWISVDHGSKATLPLTIPVAYLSRLQRILLADHLELNFKAAQPVFLPARVRKWHEPLGMPKHPYCGSRYSQRVTSATSRVDFDLEAFSHNPTHGSFAPLAFQPSAMTNCVNQRFLSY